MKNVEDIVVLEAILIITSHCFCNLFNYLFACQEKKREASLGMLGPKVSLYTRDVLGTNVNEENCNFFEF